MDLDGERGNDDSGTDEHIDEYIDRIHKFQKGLFAGAKESEMPRSSRRKIMTESREEKHNLETANVGYLPLHMPLHYHLKRIQGKLNLQSQACETTCTSA